MGIWQMNAFNGQVANGSVGATLWGHNRSVAQHLDLPQHREYSTHQAGVQATC